MTGRVVDDPDGQIGRKGVCLCASDDAFAFRWRRGLGPEEQAGPDPVGADQYRARPAGLENDRNATVEVGDEQHPSRAFAHLGHPADEPSLVECDLALGDPVIGTNRKQHRAGVHPSGIRDHPRRDEARRGVGNPVQIGLEPAIFRIQRQRHRLPLAQALVLLPQAGVLGSQRNEIAHVGPGRPDRAKWSCDKRVDRRQKVGQCHTGALG